LLNIDIDLNPSLRDGFLRGTMTHGGVRVTMEILYEGEGISITIESSSSITPSLPLEGMKSYLLKIKGEVNLLRTYWPYWDLWDLSQYEESEAGIGIRFFLHMGRRVPITVRLYPSQEEEAAIQVYAESGGLSKSWICHTSEEVGIHVEDFIDEVVDDLRCSILGCLNWQRRLRGEPPDD
jgi:hypothetical protein